MTPFTECVQLKPGLFLQASASNFRLHKQAAWQPPPAAEALLQPGDPQTTRQLMAGAFYAASSLAAVASGFVRPAPSLLRHVYSLFSSYQTTHDTPTIARHVASRLAERGHHAAAAHFLQFAEEESGHDTLALMDLAALGLPARAVQDIQPEDALELVAYFWHLAKSEDPISSLGYIYAMERAALFNKKEDIEATESVIPPGIHATRCLRVHSAVGSDVGHVDESIDFMATLPAQDRLHIVRIVFETISIAFASRPAYPGDAAMESLLAPYGWPHSAAVTV